MTAKLQYCKGGKFKVRKQLKTVKFLQFGEPLVIPKKGYRFKIALFISGGQYWIRTSDPLLVRQVL